uniref:Uncharacterized protein n=1 Tax=Palpitomonas bilix TaxID=652834 RepID=A0A7S3DB25_9EUKA
MPAVAKECSKIIATVQEFVSKCGAEAVDFFRRDVVWKALPSKLELRRNFLLLMKMERECKVSRRLLDEYDVRLAALKRMEIAWNRFHEFLNSREKGRTGYVKDNEGWSILFMSKDDLNVLLYVDSSTHSDGNPLPSIGIMRREVFDEDEDEDENEMQYRKEYQSEGEQESNDEEEEEEEASEKRRARVGDDDDSSEFAREREEKAREKRHRKVEVALIEEFTNLAIAFAFNTLYSHHP